MTTTEKGYLEQDYLDQPYLSGLKQNGGGFQAEMKIVDKQEATGFQSDILIVTPSSGILGMQAKFGKLAHYICGEGYLEREYLEESYLTECMYATQGFQAEMLIVGPSDDYHLGMQADMKIEDGGDDYHLGMQAEMKVLTDTPVGMQAEMLRAVATGFQGTFVIYNTEQLRIMCEFPSRGDGTNWTSTSTKSGDFSPNNLNTDILEQRWQSDGVIALVELRCDVGAGLTAFNDTTAILNHNFSIGARVELQGTSDPTYGSIEFSTVMTTELENMYYIAPSLPTSGYRYWRFIIQDVSNADGFLSVGTIVFGSSQIFSLNECFQLPVTFGKRHFKDSMETEGFTNVSNDRAMRKFLGLSFAQLSFDGGNYRLLQNYFSFAKTDLKCLVIPRPTRPSSLAVFAKLNQLPEENHNALEDNDWHVDLALDWDESL